MKNSIFDIKLEPESGGISAITLKADKNNMNWVAENKIWGLINSVNYDSIWGDYKSRAKNMELVSFDETQDRSKSVYSNGVLAVTVERFFSPKGNFIEKYTLKNIGEDDLFLEQDNFGIVLPFNDRYTYAEDCMINHCNTHIWCAHNVAYINALKMGISDENMGLVLTKGAIGSYSLAGCKGNNRGDFIWNLAHTELIPGEEYAIAWELFSTKGKTDFYEKIKSFDTYIGINARHFTVFEGEFIEFEVHSVKDTESIKIFLDGVSVDIKQESGGAKVSFLPRRRGEHRFWIEADGLRTFADFNVVLPPAEMIEKRVQFIVTKQQYHRADSALDGAFLAYDNTEEHMVFDEQIPDHNACHERIGMAILLTKYLQSHENAVYRKALDKYIQFVYREFFDEKTGRVYTRTGKKGERIRLYNAPWVSRLLTELYILTGNKKYLTDILTLLTFYYENGGKKFYPNGFTYLKTYGAFVDAGLKEEAGRVRELFVEHAENIIAKGTAYPKHEANFEQTIVSPAATFISEIGIITGDDTYIDEAEKHINILERFNGSQPSFHLNEIPIRYWDDYWFGKKRLYGDTFPHYWSCLTARAYHIFYKFSGEKKYLAAAEETMRNCLCLFDAEGRGHCAYVYPFMSNGVKGEFYDEWANDQDFALYFVLDTGIFEKEKEDE